MIALSVNEPDKIMLLTVAMMNMFNRTKKKSTMKHSTATSSSPKNGTTTTQTMKRNVKVCADYRTFLPQPTNDYLKNQKLMKIMKKKFIQAHSKKMQKFMLVFVETQAFSNFIEDAARLRYQSGSLCLNSTNDPGGDYSKEAGIEILNQCIQTA